jgi:predicted aspartyl protease
MSGGFRRWLVYFLFLLGACSPMMARAMDTDTADAAFKAGRFADAERHYTQLVEQSPGDARAWDKLGLLALWRNDLVAAEKYFKKSQRQKSWLAKRWPFNANTYTHLAMVHGRAGRYRVAAALLRKAAGWFPVGPFRELKVRAQQLELFEGDTPYNIDGPKVTVIPFVVTDPLPVVSVSINGSAPANFFIDTGGEGVILDQAYARETGAIIAGQIAGEYAGNERGKTGYGKINRLQLGDVTIQHLPVSTVDLQLISGKVFPGLNIKGVIGTGLLMQFLATLDYAKGQLVLRGAGLSVDAINKALALARGDGVFPMWLVETHLVFAEGSVNQLAPGMMFIDTGLASAGFHTSRDIFSQAGVAMDWSKSTMGVGAGGATRALNVTVDEVRLGRGEQAILKRNVDGIAFENDMSLFEGSLGFQVNGLVSHQVFRDCALTFDFTHMRMIVQI